MGRSTLNEKKYISDRSNQQHYVISIYLVHMRKHMCLYLDLTLTPTTFYCSPCMKYSRWTHSIAIGQSDNQMAKRQLSPEPSTSESLGPFLNK